MIGWLDIVLAVILLALFIAGLVRGLIKEVIGLAAIIIGFILAARYYLYFADLIGRVIHHPGVAKFLGFIFVFLVVLAVGSLIGFLLSKIMKGPLKFANHLLGGLVGLLEGILVCGVLIFALLAFPVRKDALLQSKLAPYCYGLTRAMIHLIPQDLKDQFKAAYQDLLKGGSKDGQKI